MISGFLALNKPSGPSSAALTNQARKSLHFRRLGHAGTLDLAAEGVLVLAINHATILIPYLLNQKIYQAVIRLGIKTDSDDAQGKVLTSAPVPALSAKEVEQALASFCGIIWQQPPQVSALHYQGERSYQIARRGEAINLLPRQIEIRSLRLLAWQLPEMTLEIECSRGTYIRALARDLGERLGCGAHLAHLTRTACSGFTLSQSFSLPELEQHFQAGCLEQDIVLPDQALGHLPRVVVEDSLVQDIKHGHRIPWTGSRAPEIRVQIQNSQGEFLAIARPEGKELVMERVFIQERANETPSRFS